MQSSAVAAQWILPIDPPLPHSNEVASPVRVGSRWNSVAAVNDARSSGSRHGRRLRGAGEPSEHDRRISRDISLAPLQIRTMAAARWSRLRRC